MSRASSLESTSLPHPADVLANRDYEPLEHLLTSPDAQAIANIPDYPDALLRWYPHQFEHYGAIKLNHGISPTVDGLRSVAALHARHISHLTNSGLAVVDHTTWVGKGNPLFNNAPTVFMVVERLTGRPLLKGEEERGQTTADKLLDYLARFTDRELCLIDIFKAHQYTFDNTNGLPPTLHDIEPRFKSATYARRLTDTLAFKAWLRGRVTGSNITNIGK